MKGHFIKYTLLIAAPLCMLAAFALVGCGSKVEADGKAEAPPPAKVEREADANLVKVDHPEQYPLATTAQHNSAPELNVTGSVNPDVSRNIPVISLASGRVVGIFARIGDNVTKDQLLMRVQSSDISQAFSDYRSAVADDCGVSGDLARHGEEDAVNLGLLVFEQTHEVVV